MTIHNGKLGGLVNPSIKPMPVMSLKRMKNKDSVKTILSPGEMVIKKSLVPMIEKVLVKKKINMGNFKWKDFAKNKKK